MQEDQRHLDTGEVKDLMVNNNDVRQNRIIIQNKIYMSFITPGNSNIYSTDSNLTSIELQNSVMYKTDIK